MPTGERVFVIRPQSQAASRENAFGYDDVASGATVYAYVGGNPLSFRDPRGTCIEDFCFGEGLALYIFLTENSVALGTAAVVAGEVATGAQTPIAAPVGVAARTVAAEVGAAETFATFSKAKAALGPRAGQQLHHIVEQCQAGRSGFSPSQLNNTRNLIWLERGAHQEVSNYYSSIPEGATETVRDSLNGLPFEEQYDFGVDVLQRILNGSQ